jgi:hypothetical protein
MINEYDLEVATINLLYMLGELGVVVDENNSYRTYKAYYFVERMVERMLNE